MKVCYIQDLSPFTELGGAQQTDKAHILYGIKRGHEIEIMLPTSPSDLTQWADIVIVSNASSFPIKLFEELQKPYVFFIHDYWPLCKYRLFYSMLDKCKDCSSRKGWLPVFLKSKLNIWLSPMHRKSWLFAYPELRNRPFHLSPSPVNPELFFDMELERSGVLAIHSHLEYKGRVRFLEYAEEHKDTQITLVGANPNDPTLPSNVTAIQFVPPYDMNALYNRHEVFLHLPTTPQPFERTIAESWFAGCKVIGNKNIGALEWIQNKEQFKSLLKDSSENFWKAIEGVL